MDSIVTPLLTSAQSTELRETTEAEGTAIMESKRMLPSSCLEYDSVPASSTTHISGLEACSHCSNSGSEQNDDGSTVHNSASGVSRNEEFGNEEYQVYPQRWVVLLVFSFLSCMNGWIWITWSPLTPELSKFWSVPASYVDDLSAVFMYVYIPLSFPALMLLHTYKLRFGLVVGALLNFAGALLRYAGLSSYCYVYWGTFLCAMAQTLTLAMPPLISSIWFREKERGVSTSLGVLANQLGSAFGLGVTVVVNFTAKQNNETQDIENDDTGGGVMNETHLENYIAVQMALSAVSLAVILVFVRSSFPPTPPSEASSMVRNNDNDDTSIASLEREEFQELTYAASVRLIIGTKSGFILCVVYGMTVGVFFAIATFLAQFYVGEIQTGESKSGNNNVWSDEETGYLGLVLILVGVLGSLISGEYLDRTQLHRSISIALLAGSVVSMVLFMFSLQFWPLSRWLAYANASILGFFLTGFVSVGFEYGTAISYPADEAAVAGVMNVAAQIVGWVLVAIGGRMGSVNIGFARILVGTLLLALILLWAGVTATNRRVHLVS